LPPIHSVEGGALEEPLELEADPALPEPDDEDDEDELPLSPLGTAEPTLSPLDGRSVCG
jgi:hypothetical protein